MLMQEHASTVCVLGPFKTQAASTGLKHSRMHMQEFWRQHQGEARVKQGGSRARMLALACMQVRPLLPFRASLGFCSLV